MKKPSRLLFAIASLLLVLTFFMPLWRITLNAPQYPEGLGLYIWMNAITGVKPHDLQNINGLNHYIGMKRIEPDSIPELKVIPFVMAFLILFGLLGVLLNRKIWLHLWLIMLIGFGLIGLADFYKWGYDYGHNLDTKHAAIKVPGMAYQPPLIGSKKLLNFTAHSLPSTGGWVLLMSMGLAVAAVYLNRTKSSKDASEKLEETNAYS